MAELDEAMRGSLGPGWAVGGVFRMYQFGGGPAGLAGFLRNIGESIDAVWRDDDGQARPTMDTPEDEGWKAAVLRQTREAYGDAPTPEDVRRRDHGLREVVRVQEELDEAHRAERST